MSAIIENNVSFPVMACNDCTHRISASECKAFDKIPDDIWAGNLHLEPLKGQKNSIVFEPVENPRWMTPEYIKKHKQICT